MKDWKSTSDGMMKWKSGLEKGLQKFGSEKVRPALRHVFKPSSRKEATGRARRMIKEEGG